MAIACVVMLKGLHLLLMERNKTYRQLPATQTEIARLAGCTRQTVAKWQRGGEVLPSIEGNIRRAIKAVEKGKKIVEKELAAA